MRRAKTDLSKLVGAAGRGEEIISRDTKACPGKRRLGALKGKVRIPKSDEWWQPMTDEQLNSFLNGELD